MPIPDTDKVLVSDTAWNASGLLLTIGMLTGSIFVLDAWLPVGVVLAILYVAPVYMSSWFHQAWVLLTVAVLCTALTVVGYAVSPPGGIPWIVMSNRLLAFAAIWATVLLALVHRRLHAEIRTLHGLIPICASCKKIRDEQGQWQVFEHYIERRTEAEFTHSICPACAEAFLSDLREDTSHRSQP